MSRRSRAARGQPTLSLPHQDVAAATADVPARSQGWWSFPCKPKCRRATRISCSARRQTALLASFIPPRFPAAAGIRWDDGQMQSRAGCYRFRLSPGGEPPRVIQTPPRPENVNQGWNRAVAGIRNAWAPDLKRYGLPQWVQLESAPAAIDAFHVSFQTRKDRGVDFDVEARVEGHWQRLAQVRDNADRRRVLHFPAVRADQCVWCFARLPGKWVFARSGCIGRNESAGGGGKRGSKPRAVRHALTDEGRGKRFKDRNAFPRPSRHSGT